LIKITKKNIKGSFKVKKNKLIISSILIAVFSAVLSVNAQPVFKCVKVYTNSGNGPIAQTVCWMEDE
jgi:hypothetical protein